MAEKYIPYDKRSKKEKRAADQKKRLDWGQVRPVTVTHKDDRDYNRKKARQDLLKALHEED